LFSSYGIFWRIQLIGEILANISPKQLAVDGKIIKGYKGETPQK
jgi:hypothetical protein